MFSKEQEEKIINFLRENTHLSANDVASILSFSGLQICSRSIANRRIKYGIEYVNTSSVIFNIKKDYEAGMTFDSGKELAERYGCSENYAREIIRRLKGIKPVKKLPAKLKQQDLSDVSTIHPVPVNTMAFWVQQLTANDDGRQVA